MSLNVCTRICACAMRQGEEKKGKKLFPNAWCNTTRIITLAAVARRFVIHFQRSNIRKLYMYIQAVRGEKNKIKHETHNPRFTTTPRRLL